MIKLIILLFIAFLCGSLGASLAGASKKGCFANIVLGFIGAMIGGWLSRKLSIGDIITLRGIPIIWSIIGAALFIALLNLISGNSGKKK